MNNSILSDSCQGTITHTFEVAGDLQVTVTELSNPFQLPIDTLFLMAARINKKRSFLFVSKLLGKHIPVNPYTPLLAGAALSLLLYQAWNTAGNEEQIDPLLEQAINGLINPDEAKEAYEALLEAKLILPRKAVFIGFAETATALGHAMYHTFAENASYIHTTREDLPGLESVLNFEEEHSHAVDHRCYALNASLLSGEEPVVLVDDEITTGKTAVNIIRDIQAQFPRREYVIASLLDWRSGDNADAYRALEVELDITITPLYLLRGSIQVTGEPRLEETITADAQETADGGVPVEVTVIRDSLQRVPVSSRDGRGEVNPAPFVKLSGRFGLYSDENSLLDTGVEGISAALRDLREGRKVLVMGVGEFMYLPMRVAAAMGEGVAYQASTRSPIYPVRRADYGVNSAAVSPSPGDPEVSNYIYNIESGQYDEIFVLLERNVLPERTQPMTEILRRLAARKVHLIVLSPEEESGAS